MPYKQPVVPCCLTVFKRQSTEEKQYMYVVRYCLKSMGCWFWPVSRWSHQCVLWMKCSVTANSAEAGLTGKHEVREDVNKRKGLLESLWRLLIITHWHGNSLISPFRTKNYSTDLHHLLLSNHINTLIFLLSYIIHANALKNVIIICEKVLMPLPVQVWKSEHDLPKSF